MPPIGNVIDFMGVSIDRLANGKIVEHWFVSNFLSFATQIGAVPTSSP